MNKLKVALQDLRDYLGRDTEGLKRLKEVEVLANEQRKRCSTLETETTEAKAAEARAIAAARTVGTERDQLKSALNAESNRRAAAEAREAILREQLAETAPPPMHEAGRIKQVVHRLSLILRKRRKGDPIRIMAGDKIYLDDFVTMFNSYECETLGMFTAMCALVGVPLTVTTHTTVWDGTNWTEEEKRDFVNWFKQCFLVRNKVIPDEFDKLAECMTSTKVFKNASAAKQVLIAKLGNVVANEIIEGVRSADLMIVPGQTDPPPPPTTVEFELPEQPDEATVERYRDIATRRVEFVRQIEDANLPRVALPTKGSVNEQVESSNANPAGLPEG